jgi:DNA-binding NarL/FixJ family response regulator
MKLKFLDDEWEELISHCGFTDDEKEIIPYLRRGWYGVDIAAELNISRNTFVRRKKSIEDRIIKYLIKAG